MSAFLGVRQMCLLPVESFLTGGCLWFPDLTAADPFCILPIYATASVIYMVHVSHKLKFTYFKKKILSI